MSKLIEEAIDRLMLSVTNGGECWSGWPRELRDRFSMALAPLAAAVAEAQEACRAMLAYVEESDGIMGWHMNGDIMEWSDCDAVPMMERAVAAKHEAEGRTP
jgi:hypothetical protein